MAKPWSFGLKTESDIRPPSTEFSLRELRAQRICLVLGLTLYPAWRWVYQVIAPQATDYLWERVIAASPCLVVFVLSYFVENIRRHMSRWILICGISITAHFFLLLHNNPDFAYYIAGGFVVVIAISSALMVPVHVIVYTIFVGLCTTALIFFNPGLPPLFLVCGFVTAVAAAYLSASNRLQLLKRLTESEKRFRAIADDVPVMIWMSDDNGFYNFFNQYWLKFTGRDERDEMGNGWLKDIYSDDLKRFLDVYGDAFRHHKEFSVDFRLKHHGGQYRWIYCQGRPRVSTKQNFTGYIGCCVDLTDRKLKEIELSKTERSYTEFLRYAPDPIITLSHLGNVMMINPSAETISGYKQSEIQGKHFASVGVVTSRSLPVAVREFQYVVRGISRPPFEIQLRRKDKKLIYVEANTQLMEDSDTGKTIQIIFRDITQRKKLENELRRRANFFCHIIDQSDELVLIMRQDRTITYASPAAERVLGKRLSELKGKTLLDCVTNEDKPRLDTAWKLILNGSRTTRITLNLKSPRQARLVDAHLTNCLTDETLAGVVLSGQL